MTIQATQTLIIIIVVAVWVYTGIMISALLWRELREKLGLFGALIGFMIVMIGWPVLLLKSIGRYRKDGDQK